MVAGRAGAAALMMLALPAAAAENSVWSVVPDKTSAKLAALVSHPNPEPGWGLLSSSMSVLPDGDQVVVTFWRAFHETRLEGTGIYRCVDELIPGGETARAWCATPENRNERVPARRGYDLDAGTMTGAHPFSRTGR